ncbi:LLM class F420-dependent oxidoreductase [Amycolatopsis rhizosphaerae]|uniref:LLM class F420-dependent oxidoreductase n=1 Tax=Amycolatopsis rhizosphaerae TaxID=2053003 RepID=A0A558DJZ1_9PSEU|nr:LLM class F420-dependent oxidoreductase [Amycolatopsis rhizosphaerae]TVT61336.1 LLM class F420-dependent oxidoreductase [Amycolatopsis rhizosphaerae]
MQIGVSTPVVFQFPGSCSKWERDGEIEDLAEIAQAADELGFAYLTCAEHVAVPVEVAAQRGGTYWDPAVTLAYLAACTQRIKLATSVVVLGYHHPLALAKRYGTLDRISGGRLVLGVGVGSLPEEFDLLGADFANRGVRADDAMRALRAALSQREPVYSGTHYEFEGMLVEPHAVQARVPLWVGGRSLRSLRRACAFGDGWMPFGLSDSALGEMLAKVELPEGFEVVLPAGPLDPGGDPEGTTRRLVELREAGATGVTVTIAAESSAHYRDQLASLRQLADGMEANVR